jgi:hypothetical protein
MSSQQYSESSELTERDRNLEKIHNALETLAHSCIVCWAMGGSSQLDHDVNGCDHGLLQNALYAQFREGFKTPSSTCWSCLCPQKVSPLFFIFHICTLTKVQLRYVSLSQSRVVTLHDGVMDRKSTCHWEKTMKPLSFACHIDPKLRHAVVMKLRHGGELDGYGESFQEWLTTVDEDNKPPEKGFNNALRVLFMFISTRGMPDTFGIHPPASRDLYGD